MYDSPLLFKLAIRGSAGDALAGASVTNFPVSKRKGFRQSSEVIGELSGDIPNKDDFWTPDALEGIASSWVLAHLTLSLYNSAF